MPYKSRGYPTFSVSSPNFIPDLRSQISSTHSSDRLTLSPSSFTRHGRFRCVVKLQLRLTVSILPKFIFPQRPAHHGGRDQSHQREDSLQPSLRLSLLYTYVKVAPRFPLSVQYSFAAILPLSSISAPSRALTLIPKSQRCCGRAEPILTCDSQIDFWGPVSNFGIPLAAVLDTQKDPDM